MNDSCFSWSLVYLHNLAKSVGMQSLKPSEVEFNETGIYIAINNQGGVYAAVLTGSYDKVNKKFRIFQNYINLFKPTYLVNQIVPFNTVSILWQIPQFVIITIAEILFSITGYEFAYSQAAPSMKALVQALWLLTTAVGDSIIVLIAVLNIFSDQAVQAFVYAGKQKKNRIKSFLRDKKFFRRYACCYYHFCTYVNFLL